VVVHKLGGVHAAGGGKCRGAHQRERHTKAVVRFREKLLVLVHITGGQPARGPELLSIRHANTVGGRHRNVFIEDGYVAIATRYHKGYTSTLSSRVIHRYLPREVGELATEVMPPPGRMPGEGGTANGQLHGPGHEWPHAADGPPAEPLHAV
jgi:hypothetical protein